jgi:WD40 repeat protein
MPDIDGEGTADIHTLNKKGQHDESVRILKKRLALNPQDWEARLMLAETYSLLSRGRGSLADLALREFLQAVEAIPPDEQLHGVAIAAAGRMGFLDLLAEYYLGRTENKDFYASLIIVIGQTRKPAGRALAARLNAATAGIIIAAVAIAGILIMKGHSRVDEPDTYYFKDWPRSGEFTRDSNGIVFSGCNTLNYFDLQLGRIYWTVPCTGITGVLLSDNGTYIKTFSSNGIRIFSSANGELIWSETNSTRYAYQSRDEAYSHMPRRKAYLLDLATGATLGTFRNRLPGVAVTADNSRVYIASSSNSIFIYDGHTDQPVGRLDETSVGISGVAVTPDGKYLASCLNYDGLSIWDTGQEKVVATVKNRVVFCAAFSQDGKTLVISSLRKTNDPYQNINDLLAISTGNFARVKTIPVAIPGRNSNWISSLMFSPDNSRLAVFMGEYIKFYRRKGIW